jgi:hypothetical protein
MFPIKRVNNECIFEIVAHHRLPLEISQNEKQTFQISKYVQGI